MNIKKIEAYQASDGTIFENRADCVAHERNNMVYNTLYSDLEATCAGWPLDKVSKIAHDLTDAGWVRLPRPSCVEIYHDCNHQLPYPQAKALTNAGWIRMDTINEFKEFLDGKNITCSEV